MAFLLKALGEYGLYVIVIGVWPRDHLLTYYNGDLDGRVEDIHLQWNKAELKQVLHQGADALRIEFDPLIEDALVEESWENVGLLQRNAEQLCINEGILETPALGLRRRGVGTSVTLDAAFHTVAGQMQGRFQTFADNFVRGMRRLSEGLAVYQHLLETVTDATDEDLAVGIDSGELLRRVNSKSPEIRGGDLTQALDRIDRLQAKIGVHPPVLTYNRSNRKLYIADNALLFFRHFGDPRWPWDEETTELSNDLAASDPLDLDEEDDDDTDGA